MHSKVLKDSVKEAVGAESEGICVSTEVFIATLGIPFFTLMPVQGQQTTLHLYGKIVTLLSKHNTESFNRCEDIKGTFGDKSNIWLDK